MRGLPRCKNSCFASDVFDVFYEKMSRHILTVMCHCCFFPCMPLHVLTHSFAVATAPLCLSSFSASPFFCVLACSCIGLHISAFRASISSFMNGCCKYILFVCPSTLDRARFHITTKMSRGHGLCAYTRKVLERCGVCLFFVRFFFFFLFHFFFSIFFVFFHFLSFSLFFSLFLPFFFLSFFFLF